jgi:hypothetical protein
MWHPRLPGSESEFLECRGEIFSGAYALIGGNNNALAGVFRRRVGQFDLAIPLGDGFNALPKRIGKGGDTPQEYGQHRGYKPLAHSAPNATRVQVHLQTGTRLAYPGTSLKHCRAHNAALINGWNTNASKQWAPKYVLAARYRLE